MLFSTIVTTISYRKPIFIVFVSCVMSNKVSIYISFFVVGGGVPEDAVWAASTSWIDDLEVAKFHWTRAVEDLGWRPLSSTGHLSAEIMMINLIVTRVFPILILL